MCATGDGLVSSFARLDGCWHEKPHLEDVGGAREGVPFLLVGDHKEVRRVQ